MDSMENCEQLIKDFLTSSNKQFTLMHSPPRVSFLPYPPLKKNISIGHYNHKYCDFDNKNMNELNMNSNLYKKVTYTTGAYTETIFTTK